MKALLGAEAAVAVMHFSCHPMLVCAGLGVIVDTYRNEEFYSVHKDVTVVYNTGNM